MEAIESTDAQGSDESTRRRAWYRRPATIAGAAACLLAVGALAIGVPLAAAASAGESTTSSAVTTTVPATPGTTTPGGASGSGRSGAFSQGGGSSGSTTSSAQAAATAADADESTGVVLIDTVLGYQNGAAAGTGMVLTGDGLVLTNNHVVEGATEISVTIASTGETYTATVVGTDATEDVALLQLEGASGLATVTLDDDDAAAAGDAITAVGNAEGGGELLAADGEITDVEATVTTASEGSVAGETLEGMIEIQADVVSGDSGGALLDDEGEVIGMTTAASSGTVITTAYAIPIDDALALVQQMLDGDESGGVTLGYPAFLGIAIAQSTSSLQGMPGRFGGQDATTTTVDGVAIAGVYDGTPAAAAGLTAGDTITAVDGTAVTDGSALSAILAEHDPGDTVTITWVDTAGATHSASVTLIAGPVA